MQLRRMTRSVLALAVSCLSQVGCGNEPLDASNALANQPPQTPPRRSPPISGISLAELAERAEFTARVEKVDFSTFGPIEKTVGPKHFETNVSILRIYLKKEDGASLLISVIDPKPDERKFAQALKANSAYIFPEVYLRWQATQSEP